MIDEFPDQGFLLSVSPLIDALCELLKIQPFGYLLSNVLAFGRCMQENANVLDFIVNIANHFTLQDEKAKESAEPFLRFVLDIDPVFLCFTRSLQDE